MQRLLSEGKLIKWRLSAPTVEKKMRRKLLMYAYIYGASFADMNRFMRGDSNGRVAPHNAKGHDQRNKA